MEYEIKPTPPPWIIGHFCMWANGQMVGDLSDTYVLGVTQKIMEDSLKCSDSRIDPDLFTEDKIEAASIIQRALYGCPDDITNAQILAHAKKYRCFSLKELGGESFHGLWVFLVASFTEQRLLWRRDGEEAVMEAIFPAGTYEQVAQEFLQAISDDISSRRALRH